MNKKISLVSTYDCETGAAIASFRLHKALLKSGVESKYIVGMKHSDHANVFGPDTVYKKGFALAKRRIDSLPQYVYRNRTQDYFSISWIPGKTAKRIGTLKPDIVHLHWVADGFMRIEDISKIDCPIVWTLHDMWPFTGGCHYSGACNKYTKRCGRCIHLGSRTSIDLSRLIWRRKHRVYKNIKMKVVSPSQWLADCARKSTLMNHFDIHVIPNGIDIDVFKPLDKGLARDIFSLPQNNKLILFGALDATSDRRKGFHLLQSVLQDYSSKCDCDAIELVVFGASKPLNPTDFNMKVNYVGRLHDESSLAVLYSACDLFLAPSLEDNLPNTILEAMSCGTPVIAFDTGGIPDLIDHKKNGYLAKPYDVMAFSHGIEWVLNHSSYRHLCCAARNKVVNEFCDKTIARKYLDLYSKLHGTKS